jgi:hypothetical protein
VVVTAGPRARPGAVLSIGETGGAGSGASAKSAKSGVEKGLLGLRHKRCGLREGLGDPLTRVTCWNRLDGGLAASEEVVQQLRHGRRVCDGMKCFTLAELKGSFRSSSGQKKSKLETPSCRHGPCVEGICGVRLGEFLHDPVAPPTLQTIARGGFTSTCCGLRMRTHSFNSSPGVYHKAGLLTPNQAILSYLLSA